MIFSKWNWRKKREQNSSKIELIKICWKLHVKDTPFAFFLSLHFSSSALASDASEGNAGYPAWVMDPDFYFSDSVVRNVLHEFSPCPRAFWLTLCLGQESQLPQILSFQFSDFCLYWFSFKTMQVFALLHFVAIRFLLVCTFFWDILFFHIARNLENYKLP